MTASREIDILLVEDSPTDALLTREALATGHIVNTLTVATRGEEALEILRDPAAHRPDMVLLDLNLPGMSGLDVLASIKQDPALRGIPVVMLTTSADEEDVAAAYRSYANAYVRKPVDLAAFLATVTGLGEFWVSIVTLPEASN